MPAALLKRWLPPVLVGAVIVVAAAVLREEAPPPVVVEEVLPGGLAWRLTSALGFWVMLSGAVGGIVFGVDRAGQRRRGWWGWWLAALVGVVAWLA